MCDFWIEAGGRANDCDGGIGIEAVENTSGGDLREKDESGMLNETCGIVTWWMGMEEERVIYLAAANDKHVLALDLPGEDKAASALDFGESVVLRAHSASHSQMRQRGC